MGSKTDTEMIARFVERYCSREAAAPSFEEIEASIPMDTLEIERGVQELVEAGHLKIEWTDVGSSQVPVYRSRDFTFESHQRS